MTLLKLFFVFFVVKSIENAKSFNPSLTYMVRFHKIRYYPNIFGNYTIYQHDGKEFVKGNVTINSTNSIDRVDVIFNRCDSEGIDCEYFQSWTLTDLCSKIKDPNQIWSSWYGKFDPPLDCPINKIHYQVKNASIEIDRVIKWYSEAVNYQWKVTQTFYAGDIKIGSYTVDASIFGYRKRSDKSSRH